VLHDFKTNHDVCFIQKTIGLRRLYG